MGLQSDAIEIRLEGLKLDDRRMMFDSQLRAFRMDSKPPATGGALASQAARRPEPDQPIGQVIALLEELSRRIDGLEKKQRTFSEEIRHRARQDRRWRSMSAAGGLAASGLLAVAWLMRWF